MAVSTPCPQAPETRKSYLTSLEPQNPDEPLKRHYADSPLLFKSRTYTHIKAPCILKHLPSVRGKGLDRESSTSAPKHPQVEYCRSLNTEEKSSEFQIITMTIIFTKSSETVVASDSCPQSPQNPTLITKAHILLASLELDPQAEHLASHLRPVHDCSSTWDCIWGFMIILLYSLLIRIGLVLPFWAESPVYGI